MRLNRSQYVIASLWQSVLAIWYPFGGCEMSIGTQQITTIVPSTGHLNKSLAVHLLLELLKKKLHDPWIHGKSWREGGALHEHTRFLIVLSYMKLIVTKIGTNPLWCDTLPGEFTSSKSRHIIQY
jgi:hypothetical protein